MTRRRIANSKRRHEADKYIRHLMAGLYDYMEQIVRVDVPTTSVEPSGVGRIFVPSQSVFEHLNPLSAPIGIVFYDSSFLTVKEIFRYDYANTESEPRIIRSEFSYHYQSPPRQFFFRYDHHPGIGNLTTHPLYHLHVGCWHTSIEKFPGTPRFRAPEVMLEEVLELIMRDFLT